MILLVLVALWIVVLAPAGVKKVLDRRSVVSVDTFHQQLSLLRRAGRPAARRLQTVQSTTGLAVGQSGYPAVSSRPTLVLVPPVPTAGAGEPVGRQWAAGRDRLSMAGRAAVRRRRRDVLLWLVGAMVVSALMGIAVPLCWALTGLAAVALAGYVGLAAYAQALEAERRLVAPLVPPAGVPVPAVAAAEGWEHGDWSAGGWSYGELPRAAAGG